MKGRVKWWSKEKGYGFIEYNEEDSVFAHLSSKDKNIFLLNENQEIEFTIEEKLGCQYLHILKSLKN